MATIKAIEGRSVHQIQSGQVIVDLCSVVKELVENSLDAGATSIDVRFKNHGLDSIEVQDNGKGFSPDDYETVALKHHTSKLSTYDDLTSLDTFGFRGEALSSLCALSKFRVLTARTEDGAVGKRLDFEVSGKLKSVAVAAAQRGTTVSVDELFYNLPVRRKELEKNIKREYGKVLGFLHAYACISVGVRFAVSSQMAKNKKVAVFSTKSNTTTKENIVNVFGAKTLVALIKLDLCLEMQPSIGPTTQSARNWSTQANDRRTEVRVEGHISRPVFGEGRQAPDRQMFFVNSRPCALPQVSKAVNEVYKSFNVTQSPFIFANLILDTNSYDVNVSPDKRTIMLHDQTALLERLKEKLNEMFEDTEHTVPQSTLPNKKLPSYKPLTMRGQGSNVAKSPEVTLQSEDGSGDGGSESEASSGEPEPGHKIVNSVLKGSQPSLISDWAGRKTEARRKMSLQRGGDNSGSKEKGKPFGGLEEPDTDDAAAKGVANVAGIATVARREATALSKEPDSLGVESAPEPEKRMVTADATDSPMPDAPADPLSTAYDDLFSQRPPNLPKAPPQESAPTATMLPLEAAKHAGDGLPDRRHSGEIQRQASSESQINAMAPGSQKPTPGPVENAFDRMRPKRTPLQTAEITVGDSTTTTVIGTSPAFKKRRVHAPQNSQSIAKFGASPLLARGLQRFGATGSEMVSAGNVDMLSAGSSPSLTEVSKDEDDREEEGSELDHDEVAVQEPESEDHASDSLDTLLPVSVDNSENDQDYVDEREKRMQEDEKVAHLIQAAEEDAARPTDDNLRRASQVLKNSGSRAQSTLRLTQTLNVSIGDLQQRAAALQKEMTAFSSREQCDNAAVKGELDSGNAESKLSLTVSKADFERINIIGQFNLGFILATRPASKDGDEDELFIIDQHAADEKYNYERLQRTVTLQSQRLVRPKPLELTAVEEEIIQNHTDALKANGFEIEIVDDTDNDDDENDVHLRNRCRLLTLPISGEKTFDISDLEELLHLLSEAPPGSNEMARPKKVQRMLAMRACRSSIMVGRTLTMRDMRRVVKQMGGMEKPWNCPHGRPTMRHLAGLGAWGGWKEGDGAGDDGVDSLLGGEDEEGGTQWSEWLSKRT
ncbi:hypothetical protein B0A50_02750 [Salinomyces thailandicus]|uniref:DNA mismatch repair protein PMS1 n=1 Tax=Salinomyces thailandicus TaxID=706561 RepID=A0A4U0U4J8_9PEZI|nr:hypothetical protein B0A50_02750 [Salinomyces thailandica]